MKKMLKKLSVIFGAGAILFLSTSASGSVSTNAAAAELLNKSVFNDDAKTGKDPFFPKSTRRAGRTSTSPAPILAPIIQLALKGISGPANNRLALINNQPITEGETALVRVPGGQVKVRCWEIKTDSAVVSVEGESEKKELRLRKDFK